MAETGKSKKIGITLLFLLTVIATGSPSDEITVQAEVNKTEVYRGGSLIYQIRVIGSDQVAAPRLEHVEQFDVRFLGGRVNSSSSITIINDKTIEEVHKEYILPYKLVPTEIGTIKIPPITVSVGGEQYETEPVVITSREPREMDDFKLKAFFSKDGVFVEESVLFTLVWYIGNDVDSFDVRVPFLDRKEFTFSDPPPDTSAGTASRLRIPFGGQEITAIRGEDFLEGRQYTTLTIKKVVTPLKKGDYYIPKAIISLMSDGNSLVIPSNDLTLSVKSLPNTNKPDDFSGIVGNISVETTADPQEVAVREPITVLVTVSGAPYLERVDLTDIQDMDGFKNQFKVTAGINVLTDRDSANTITLSLRPLHAEIKEIPPITLSYFDPDTGSYRAASSKPIPITVRQEPVMSFDDLEGSPGGAESQHTAESAPRLIEDNYTTPASLHNRSSRLSAVSLHLVFLILSAFAVVVSFLMYWKNRKQTAPAAVGKPGRTWNNIREEIKDEMIPPPLSASYHKHHPGISPYCDRLYTKLVHCLSAELSLPPRSSTPADITAALRDKGFDCTTVQKVGQLLSRLQRIRYTGEALPDTLIESMHDCYEKTLECLERLDLEEK